MIHEQIETHIILHNFNNYSQWGQWIILSKQAMISKKRDTAVEYFIPPLSTKRWQSSPILSGRGKKTAEPSLSPKLSNSQPKNLDGAGERKKGIVDNLSLFKQ